MDRYGDTEMIHFPISFFGQAPEQGSKYDVLTLHREWDNVCVVRLRGFDNTVFWKEIKLDRWWLRSPRQRILKAQDKARSKAEKLRWRDMKANHEFDITAGVIE